MKVECKVTNLIVVLCVTMVVINAASLARQPKI